MPRDFFLALKFLREEVFAADRWAVAGGEGFSAREITIQPGLICCNMHARQQIVRAQISSANVVLWT